MGGTGETGGTNGPVTVGGGGDAGGRGGSGGGADSSSANSGGGAAAGSAGGGCSASAVPHRAQNRWSGRTCGVPQDGQLIGTARDQSKVTSFSELTPTSLASSSTRSSTRSPSISASTVRPYSAAVATGSSW